MNQPVNYVNRKCGLYNVFYDAKTADFKLDLVPAPRGPELRLWVGMRDSAAPKQPLVNGCAAITRNKSNILKQCGEKAAFCSSFTCLKAPPRP